MGGGGGVEHRTSRAAGLSARNSGTPTRRKPADHSMAAPRMSKGTQPWAVRRHAKARVAARAGHVPRRARKNEAVDSGLRFG